MKINFETFAPIRYGAKTITIDERDKQQRISPLVKLWTEVMNECGLLFLTGEATHGKSVNIDVLRLWLLKNGKPFYYFGLKDINDKTLEALKISMT